MAQSILETMRSQKYPGGGWEPGGLQGLVDSLGGPSKAASLAASFVPKKGFGNVVGGALSGAGTGSTIGGAVGGPVGAGVGAVIGGTIGAITGGSQWKAEQHQRQLEAFRNNRARMQ